MVKRLSIFSLLIVIIALSARQVWQPATPPPPINKPRYTVDSETILSHPHTPTLSAFGNSIPFNSVTISPEVAGRIKRIDFTPGQYVKKGAVLVELDSTILKQQIVSIKANYHLKQLTLKRIGNLAAKQLASSQALDEARAAVSEKAAELNVKQAELAKMTLRAPFSGKLGEQHANLGEYVPVGKALVSLYASDKLIVQYRVTDDYLPRLKIGQQLTLRTSAFKGKTFNATVRYVSPTVEVATRTLLVKGLIDNREHQLVAGLLMHITHHLGPARNVVMAPEESVVASIDGYHLFVIDKEQVAHSRAVTLGQHHQHLVEITSGLAIGERVVINGQQKIKDGSLINIHPLNDKANA